MLLRIMRRFGAIATGVLACLCASAALAAPAGWTGESSIVITAGTSAVPLGYQLRIELNTAAMITAGTLRSDGGDLRFATDSAGTDPLQFFIASGINTTTTVVYVRTPAIAASAQRTIYMFSGNPSATSQSTALTFDYDSLSLNTSMQQGTPGGAGGVADSNRGHRFQPPADILLVSLGGKVPNASTRTVNLFDVSTQAILRTADVSLTGTGYAYSPVTPLLLEAGHQYIINVHQGPGEGYYFGGSGSSFNPKLGYLDMRYCNSCSATTFPQSFLSDVLYGYPDFEFRTLVSLASPPTYQINTAPPPLVAVPFNPLTPALLAIGLFGLGGLLVHQRRLVPARTR